MFETHSQLIFSKFLGIFDRGRDEACPADYLLECDNMIFQQNSVKMRHGQFQMGYIPGGSGGWESVAASQLVEFFRVYSETPTSIPKYIVSLGIPTGAAVYFYKGDGVFVGPIMTIPGWGGAFNALQVGTRIYIMPLDGHSNLYVFDTEWTVAREAGGDPPPSAPPIGTAAVSPGQIQAGFHIVAVAYETNTGYITDIGAWTGVNFDGAQRLDLTNIPVAPASAQVVKRHIVFTKVIYNFDGNVRAQEYFFVNGGTIENNLPGQTLSINPLDSELVDSADDYRDQLHKIPNSRRITLYNGRLVAVAPMPIDPTDTKRQSNTCYVSRKGELESVDNVDGILVSDPPTYRGIEDVAELRGNLYIFRDNLTQVTQDDDTPPREWKIVTVDKSRGIRSNSNPDWPSVAVGQYNHQPVAIDDVLICRSSDGLYTFNGTFLAEVSWAVKDKFQFFPDDAALIICPVSRYIIFGFASGSNHLVYIGDYTSGLSVEAIKWSTLTLNSFALGGLVQWKVGGLYTLYGDGNNVIVLSRFRVFAWARHTAIYFDEWKDGTGAAQQIALIKYHYRLPYIYPDDGWIYQFNELLLRVEADKETFAGNVDIELFSLDDKKILVPSPISVIYNPGIPYRKWFNFVSEACSIKVSHTPTSSMTGFDFKTAVVAFKKLWLMRPH